MRPAPLFHDANQAQTISQLRLPKCAENHCVQGGTKLTEAKGSQIFQKNRYRIGHILRRFPRPEGHKNTDDIEWQEKNNNEYDSAHQKLWNIIGLIED
jgi:hypothetical protein